MRVAETSQAADELRALQLEQLRRLIAELLPDNAFYAPKLHAAGLADDLDRLTLEAFSQRLEPTTKAELVDDQQRLPPYGSNLTYPLDRYVRWHQTSGTSGQPLRWLDTHDSWQWMLDSWRRVLEVCGVEQHDRVFVPFSFGPFLGFWTAFEAAMQIGCLVLPGGGMGSHSRLAVIAENRATVLCCTPTYAIRLAQVARQSEADVSSIKRLFVAGEPGGSVAEVRDEISRSWGGAQVFDHHGMTEVGPVSFANPRYPGTLHVIGSAYYAEIVDPESGQSVTGGEVGELLLTTLGRLGSPLLRYRTGDLVRRSSLSAAELGFADLALEGGILARADDMVVVRGVNLYPSAVDSVVRRFPSVAEYQVELRSDRAMTEASLKIEALPDAEGGADRLARQIQEALRMAFQLRLPVIAVAPGSLPRHELKAKRWLRVRGASDGAVGGGARVDP